MTTSAGPVYEVEYTDGKRFVRCNECGELASHSIVTHLKKKHPSIWKAHTEKFIELRKQGFSSKEIMWHFGRVFTWTVIERVLAESGVAPRPAYRRKISLEPKDFSLQTTTVWSFTDRGKWAVHDGKYRGNWAPEVPRNLILRYSNEGDLVLDPFLGGGTTATEAFLLRRNFVGIDISPAAVQFARAKLQSLKRRVKPKWHDAPRIRLATGDVRYLRNISNESVQLICAHPPYLDIIEYTRKNPADLSTITDPERYVRALRAAIKEMYRCLKPGGYLAMLIGDVRRNGKLVPLGFRTQGLIGEKLDICEIVIKLQHRCSTNQFWNNQSNFLRLSHEYLLIARKQVNEHHAFYA